jgi:hypothetical protein
MVSFTFRVATVFLVVQYQVYDVLTLQTDTYYRGGRAAVNDFRQLTH